MTQNNARQKLLVFGASGHAKVIIDLIEKTGCYDIAGVFDDNLALRGSTVFGYVVMGGKDDLLMHTEFLKNYSVVVAIGSNAIRQKIGAWLIAQGATLSSALIHPSAQIARGVLIGAGSVVMAGAVVNADSQIGRNVIVNSLAVIEHDCVIGNAVHIAPSATLCGGIKVGDNTLIGAGAVIPPNVTIGSDVIVGAGATVLQDIEDGLVVVGSPAKPI